MPSSASAGTFWFWTESAAGGGAELVVNAGELDDTPHAGFAFDPWNQPQEQNEWLSQVVAPPDATAEQINAAQVLDDAAAVLDWTSFDYNQPQQQNEHFSQCPMLPGMFAWYDFSDKATLFTDTAFTTPVAADSDPIGGVLDKSGAGNNLTQGTAGSRPLYKTGILNGLSISRYDGTDDYLTNTTINKAQPLTFVAVVTKTLLTSHRTVVDGIDASNNTTLWRSNLNTWNIHAGTGVTGPPSEPFTATHIFTAVFNGASSAIYMDGALVASGNAGTNGWLTGMRIGADRVPGAFFDGDIAEVLTYDRVLSAAELDQVETCLEEKWGVVSGEVTLAAAVPQPAQIDTDQQYPDFEEWEQELQLNQMEALAPPPTQPDATTEEIVAAHAFDDAAALLEWTYWHPWQHEQDQVETQSPGDATTEEIVHAHEQDDAAALLEWTYWPIHNQPQEQIEFTAPATPPEPDETFAAQPWGLDLNPELKLPPDFFNWNQPQEQTEFWSSRVHLENNAEGGTDDVFVVSGSAGNTGGASGNWFDDASGLGRVRFENDRSIDSMAYKLSKVNDNPPFVSWIGPSWAGSGENQLGRDLPEVFVRFYVWIAAYAPGDITLFNIADDSFSLCVKAGITGTDSPFGKGVLFLGDGSGTSVGAGTVPLERWVRVELHAKLGASSAKEFRVWYTDPNSAGAPDLSMGPSAVTSFGNLITSVEMGNTFFYTGGGDLFVDNLGVDTLDWLGPLGTAPAETGESPTDINAANHRLEPDYFPKPDFFLWEQELGLKQNEFLAPPPVVEPIETLVAADMFSTGSYDSRPMEAAYVFDTYEQNTDPPAGTIPPPAVTGDIRRVPRWAKQRNFYPGGR